MSDCLDCQAICHGRWSLRMVRSFRATAMRATIFGLPAATRRSKKALTRGLWAFADHGAHEQGGAHGVASSADEAPTTPLAGLAGERGQAAERGDLLSAERPELGQLSDQRARDGRPYAWLETSRFSLSHQAGEPRGAASISLSTLASSFSSALGNLLQACFQTLQPRRVAVDYKRLSTRTNSNVKTIPRYVDANSDHVHGDPALPNLYAVSPQPRIL